MSIQHIRRAPIQMIVLAFDDLGLDASVRYAIELLATYRAVWLLDSLALTKTIDGDIVAIEFAGLPHGYSVSYGGIIRAIFGLDGARTPVKWTNETALGEAMLVDNEFEYGMTAEELASVLEDIPRRGGAIILLLEHRWMNHLREAAHTSNACILAQDFLSPETLSVAAGYLLRQDL